MKHEPKAFVAIEEGIARKINEGLEKRLAPILFEVARACRSRDHGAAYRAVDKLDLRGIVADEHEHIEQLATMAVLFGRSQVATSFFDDDEPFPPQIGRAIGQLTHMVEVNAASFMRDQLRAIILEDERERQASFHVVALNKAFDESEPRDDKGRWSGGTPRMSDEDFKRLIEESKAEGRAARKILSGATDKNGELNLALAHPDGRMGLFSGEIGSDNYRITRFDKDGEANGHTVYTRSDSDRRQMEAEVSSYLRNGFKIQVEKFDPDQPRDEKGQWATLTAKQALIEGVTAALKDPATGIVYPGRNHGAAYRSMPTDVQIRFQDFLRDGNFHSTRHAGFVETATGKWHTREEMRDLLDDQMNGGHAEGLRRILQDTKDEIAALHKGDRLWDDFSKRWVTIDPDKARLWKWEAIVETRLKKFDPSEARDDHGRWTDGVTSDPGEAMKALADGRGINVGLGDLPPLLERIHVEATDAVARGEKPSHIDLANVKVPGTHLFAGGNLGIPRDQMPQLNADQRMPFILWLRQRDIGVMAEHVPVAELRATQKELNGASIAALFTRIKGEGYDKPVFISRDNHILDGHHQWAARVAIDAEHGKLGKETISVERVDEPIAKLLALAEEFTEGKGKRDVHSFTQGPLAKDDLDAEDLAEDGGLLEPEQAGRKKLRRGCACCTPVTKADSDDAGDTLYVHRPLLNADDVRAWADEQGLTTTLAPDDMHVTVIYAKAPVEGIDAKTDTLTVSGGYRGVHQFGDATVLQFSCDELEQRNAELLRAGGTTDFPVYKSHITITYDSPRHVSSIQPYDGDLIFGPEEFAPLKDDGDWQGDITEVAVNKADTETLAEKLNRATMTGKTLFDAASNLTTSRLINFGFLDSVKGVATHYQINEVLDDRTCLVCRYMHGRTFPVLPEYSKVLMALGTDDPAQLKANNPWPGQSKAAIAELHAMSDADLFAHNFTGPPFHPRCRGFLSLVGDVKPFDDPADLESQAQDIIAGVAPNDPQVVESAGDAAEDDEAAAEGAAAAELLAPEGVAVNEYQDVLDALQAEIDAIPEDGIKAKAQLALDSYDLIGAQQIVDGTLLPDEKSLAAGTYNQDGLTMDEMVAEVARALGISYKPPQP